MTFLYTAPSSDSPGSRPPTSQDPTRVSQTRGWTIEDSVTVRPVSEKGFVLWVLSQESSGPRVTGNHRHKGEVTPSRSPQRHDGGVNRGDPDDRSVPLRGTMDQWGREERGRTRGSGRGGESPVSEGHLSFLPLWSEIPDFPPRLCGPHWSGTL